MSAHRGALESCATRTLEEMCFFFVSQALNDEQVAAEVDGTMEVRFKGPQHGRLVVSLAGGMLPVMASNMLGDAEGTPDMQRDALGELANVICGNLLPEISGSGAIYDIEPARRTIVLHSEHALPAATVQLGLEDGGRADLILFLDQAAA